MKKYSEIKEVAIDLYGASSSKKEEWIEEYEAHLNGEYNTVWDDEGFADWTEEEKKECLNIILENYKETTIRKTEIRIVEVKYSGSINDYTLDELVKMAWSKMEKRGDFTPDRIEENSDRKDGEAWIEDIMESNKLAYIGIASDVEDEEEE